MDHGLQDIDEICTERGSKASTIDKLDDSFACAPRWSTRFSCAIKNGNNYRRVLGEVLGTTLLMLFVGGSTMTTSTNMTLMDHALTAAFGIIVIIFAIGSISGAHVNPAVTFGFACSGKFPWTEVPMYVLGQLIGSILGTFLSKALFQGPLELMLSIPYQGVVVSFFMELILGAQFMFLTCSISSNAQVTGLYGSIGVAASIATNIMIAGAVSSASMNPARSLGPAILAGHLKDVWIFMLGPCVGTAFGALFHRLLAPPQEAPATSH